MNKHLNIVILTAPSPTYAAGVLAYNLLELLKKDGHECKIITNTYGASLDKNIIVLPTKLAELRRRLKSALGRRLIRPSKTDENYYMFGLNQKRYKPVHKAILSKLKSKPDFFIYLFPQFFINAKGLYQLNSKSKVPIIWYMMDMAPMTGGCHYTWECMGYKNNCGCCPGIFSTNPNDLTKKNLKYKKKYISKTDIYPVATSEWHYEQLKGSYVFKGKMLSKIFEPTNEDKYTPSNTTKARMKFQLPLEKKVVFFGAAHIHDKRKGYKLLIEALHILATKLDMHERSNLHLAIAGNLDNEAIIDLPFDFTYMGYLKHAELPQAYHAADIFVCPTVQDTGPMMVSQSILSGTPVVAFKMGVSQDLVITGETGYQAKFNDAGDFANGMKNLLQLDQNTYQEMAKKCRDIAMQTVSYKAVASDFNKLFKEINANK